MTGKVLPVLEVKDLCTHFVSASGSVRAVDGVSFTVNEGEILGLVGESGSGKSVTGFSILGLVDPPGRVVSGSILFRGRELVGLDQSSMRCLRGNRIAMIFQDPMMTLNPSLRIGQQMVEAIHAHASVSRDVALSRARESLRKLGITAIDDRLESYPHQLSGGMRQRVVIATALLNEPDLIIADEPTTALDVTIQAQILYEVQKLCAESNTALIWITHDLSVVAGLADRVCVMYAGKDVETGPVDDVIDSPKHPYTQGLLNSVPSSTPRGYRLRQLSGTTPLAAAHPLGCSFAPRCGRRRELCDLAPDRSSIGSERSVRCHFPMEEDKGGLAAPISFHTGDDAASGAPMLSVRSVSRHFVHGNTVLSRQLSRLGLARPPGLLKAVSDVSFDVNRGEIVGLVGESGCGKSTLGRMIAGLMAPTSGDIRLDGRPLTTSRNNRKGLEDLQIQMIFQDPFASLNPRLKVGEIIGAGARIHGVVSELELDDYVDYLMRKCGLDPSAKSRYPHQFSGGQRQRIGIARALAVKPRFLVCDESVSALDVSVQAQIVNLFVDLRDEFGLTYLFISHDLGIIEHICDRVLVMYLGKIVEESPADSLFPGARHPYTRALLEEIPTLARRSVAYQPMAGEMPSPLAPPSGCAFHPRCPRASDLCEKVSPSVSVKDKSRVYCHHPVD